MEYLTKSEKKLAVKLLEKFFDAFEYDDSLKAYIDGGRITCMITDSELTNLISLINKLS